MLGDYNRINVTHGSWSGKRNCMIKRCRCRDKFFVFVDDGATTMSRLFGTSCKKHLTSVVEKAIEFNKTELKKIKARERRAEIANAKKILKVA